MGDLSPYTGRKKTRSGRTISVEVAWDYRRDDSGDVVGFVSVISDITERLNAEEQLRQSRIDIVGGLLNSVQANVAYIDLDIQYRYFNASYGKLFNIQPKTALGMKVRDIVGEQVFGNLMPHMEIALAGTSEAFSVAVRDGSGDPRQLSVVYQPDIDDRGDVLGFFVVAEDETELRSGIIALEHSEERYA